MTRPFAPTSVTLLVSALMLAVAPGCASGPPPVATPEPTLGPIDTSTGAHLRVSRQGQWYGGTVVQPLPDGRVVIHYDNSGNEWNEAVTVDRLQPFPGAAPVGYHAGERVLVVYQSRLLVADIVSQLAPDQWRVHYDGFGNEAGENVTADRLKRPFTGPSPHAVGDTVTVDVNGKPMPAKVLAASAANRWIVRFDNFGPEYDQEINPDRIVGDRKQPAAAGAPAMPAPVVVPPPTTASSATPSQPQTTGLAPQPADKPKTTGPVAQPGVPATGESVLVSQNGAWLPATVTEASGTGVKVKFANGGGEGFAQLEQVVRPPANLRGLQYTANQSVLVEFKGIYVAGKIIRAEGKDFKVRFDGTGPDNDEVVPARRLRPR